jgi:transcriptional regulator with XRE-family HTH domain
MSGSAQKLWDARIGTGLSREKVAASLGVSSKTIERWERGTSPVKRYQLIRLAELYGVAIASLEEPVAA